MISGHARSAGSFLTLATIFGVFAACGEAPTGWAACGLVEEAVRTEVTQDPAHEPGARAARRGDGAAAQ